MLEKLLALLQEEDSQEQELAAQEIINLKDSASIEPLINLLSHPTPIIRATAAYILGELSEITDNSVLNPLIHLLLDEDLFVQVQACAALGQIGNLQAFDPIFDILLTENLYRDPENILGNTAAAALNNLASNLLGKNLIKVLIDNSDSRRSIAAYWLGEIKAKEAEPHLIKILLDQKEDLETKYATSQAIRNIADSKTLLSLLPLLENAFNNEEEDFIPVFKDIFSSAFSAMDSQEIEDYIAKFLKEPSVFTRSLATWQLAKLPSNKAIPFLLEILKDPNLEICWIAIHLLGEFKEKTVIEPLKIFLKSPIKEIRQETILTLGKIGEIEVLEPLLTLLTDPDSTIRNTTVQAISLINSPKVVESLIPMLSDLDEEVRYNTIQALEQLKDERAIEPLEKLLLEVTDQDPFLIDSIKIAIENIKAPKNFSNEFDSFEEQDFIEESIDESDSSFIH